MSRGPLTHEELTAVIDPDNEILSEIVSDKQHAVVEAMANEIQLHREAMAPHLLRATRLYTDELGQLRKRVAELEAINEAGARAVEALESIGEQARQRIAELEDEIEERNQAAMERDR